MASRQIRSRFLFSIADFFPPNCRLDFYCRQIIDESISIFYCRFLPAKSMRRQIIDESISIFYCRFLPAKVEESISIADFFPPSSDPIRSIHPPSDAIRPCAARRPSLALASRSTYLPYLPPLAPISDRTSSVHHPGHNNIIGRTLIY
jgi:hypothetical protein